MSDFIVGIDDLTGGVVAGVSPAIPAFPAAFPARFDSCKALGKSCKPL